MVFGIGNRKSTTNNEFSQENFVTNAEGNGATSLGNGANLSVRNTTTDGGAIDGAIALARSALGLSDDTTTRGLRFSEDVLDRGFDANENALDRGFSFAEGGRRQAFDFADRGLDRQLDFSAQGRAQAFNFAQTLTREALTLGADTAAENRVFTRQLSGDLLNANRTESAQLTDSIIKFGLPVVAFAFVAYAILK